MLCTVAVAGLVALATCRKDAAPTSPSTPPADRPVPARPLPSTSSTEAECEQLLGVLEANRDELQAGWEALEKDVEAGDRFRAATRKTSTELARITIADARLAQLREMQVRIIDRFGELPEVVARIEEEGGLERLANTVSKLTDDDEANLAAIAALCFPNRPVQSD